jgi:hypothetical protein
VACREHNTLYSPCMSVLRVRELGLSVLVVLCEFPLMHRVLHLRGDLADLPDPNLHPAHVSPTHVSTPICTQHMLAQHMLAPSTCQQCFAASSTCLECHAAPNTCEQCCEQCHAASNTCEQCCEQCCEQYCEQCFEQCHAASNTCEQCSDCSHFQGTKETDSRYVLSQY